jgi:glycine C-acetyltransferase
MVSLRNPTAFLGETVQDLISNNFDWKIHYLQAPSQPITRLDDKEVLMMNTNNYLGLSTHPEIINAAMDATLKFGVGAGAVPVIAGTFDLTQKFQDLFAKFKEVEASLLCQTGFAVNSGLIPQLVGKEDYIISDALNHGSIIDGVRLSEAKRGIYEHNNMDSLRKKLIEVDKNGARRILIITDGVFSMDGDIAKLPEIVELAEQFGAMVYVDDCHGEGVLGKGRGIVAHFGLQGKVHVEGGSMSKGFGVFGGTVAGSRDLIDFAINKSRTYLLSTAHPPGVIAACIKAIEIVKNHPGLVEKLWYNTAYFKEQIDAFGFNTGNSQTPIIPIILGDPGKTQKIAQELLVHHHIFTTPIVFPMVAKELSRIRIQISASHSIDQLDRVSRAIAHIAKELGLIT